MDYKGLYSSVKIAMATLGIFICFISSAQTAEKLVTIKASTNVQALQNLATSFTKEHSLTAQKMAMFKMKGADGKTFTDENGSVVGLADIGEDGTPLFYTTHADLTSKVSRADALYAEGFFNAGITGEGMTVGVWDSGIALKSHTEYSGRVLNADNSDVIDNHATMVTGTLISSGVNNKAKGVAYGAQALTHNWTRDKVEVAEAAAEGLLLSNHSYGITTSAVPDWYFGAYIKIAQDWDKIMYNAPYYLMVAAAGNAQNSFDNATPNFGRTQDGFDLLVGFTTAKNNLVVAGVDARIDADGNVKKANVSGYSSFGPTDDGRIKPDISGDGTSIYTTGSANNTNYRTAMGTSMAAPGVTGSLLLLQQYHEELEGNYMKAATLKGLALHTADDIANPGPDYKMGWGLINTKRAAEVIRSKDFSSEIREIKLTNGETVEFDVTANGVEPLEVSISWTDPESGVVNRGTLNDMKAALVNDLDIRVTKGSNTYFPWKLNPAQASADAIQGDNKVDPFEKIQVNDAEGVYTITITHKGELYNGSQDVSVIVSGIKLTDCQLVAPENVSLLKADATSATINWDALSAENLYEIQFKNENSSTWTTVTTWDGEIVLEDLTVGNNYQVKVQSVCTANLSSGYSEEFNFTFNGEETSVVANPVQTNAELSLKVFPNPAVNYLQIDADVSTDAQFSIINMAGGTIKNGKAKGDIDVSNLESGLYIITVMDYSGIKSTKFYKS
ncbi:S8 family serine peptidase [Croceivirga sp. JEA036]|uniref:S8 family serine peptidase n=1 Tax=Croceivirga sp. JEA036 TaxID=2721162 RepID=UPI00143A4552|nr:S8 family serine peptidase [Croceivirga sp. JEA036]NJB38150.1 S8 family serine peptidase [Croceivirga sp. JEA036]